MEPDVTRGSTIPQDFQIEVLAYLVRDREVISRFVGVLTERSFENPVHRVIFFLVRKYFVEFLNVPSRHVLEQEIGHWLQENERSSIVPAEFYWREVDKLYRIPVADRDYLISKTQGYVLRAQIAKLAEVALRAAQRPEVDLATVSAEVNTLYRTVAGTGDERMEFLFADSANRTHDNPAVLKVPTGLRTLDQCLGGGLGKGELGVVIAPTGWGKSHFLITVGANAVRFRKKVLHVTLELSRTKTIARYESYLTGVVRRTIHENSARVVERIQRIRQLVNPADVLVMEYPSRGLSVDELRAAINQIQISRDFHFDLIVVDYADIIKPVLTHREEAGWEQLATIYERLRGVAQECDLPIWTGSQTTPDSMRHEIITIADIAGSFSKARIADVVMAICRTSAEQATDRGRFYLDKNRDEVSHVTIPFRQDFNTSRFWEEATAVAHREVSATSVEFSSRE